MPSGHNDPCLNNLTLLCILPATWPGLQCPPVSLLSRPSSPAPPLVAAWNPPVFPATTCSTLWCAVRAAHCSVQGLTVMAASCCAGWMTSRPGSAAWSSASAAMGSTTSSRPSSKCGAAYVLGGSKAGRAQQPAQSLGEGHSGCLPARPGKASMLLKLSCHHVIRRHPHHQEHVDACRRLIAARLLQQPTSMRSACKATTCCPARAGCRQPCRGRLVRCTHLTATTATAPASTRPATFSIPSGAPGWRAAGVQRRHALFLRLAGAAELPQSRTAMPTRRLPARMHAASEARLSSAARATPRWSTRRSST